MNEIKVPDVIARLKEGGPRQFKALRHFWCWLVEQADESTSEVSFYLYKAAGQMGTCERTICRYIKRLIDWNLVKPIDRAGGRGRPVRLEITWHKQALSFAKSKTQGFYKGFYRSNNKTVPISLSDRRRPGGGKAFLIQSIKEKERRARWRAYMEDPREDFQGGTPRERRLQHLRALPDDVIITRQMKEWGWLLEQARVIAYRGGLSRPHSDLIVGMIARWIEDRPAEYARRLVRWLWENIKLLRIAISQVLERGLREVARVFGRMARQEGFLRKSPPEEVKLVSSRACADRLSPAEKKFLSGQKINSLEACQEPDDSGEVLRGREASYEKGRIHRLGELFEFLIPPLPEFLATRQ